MTHERIVCNCNFKKLRRYIDLTQDEMGVILGLKRSTIGAIDECRAEVQLPTLKKLIDGKLIANKEIYDFLFNRDWEPKTKVRYKRILKLISVN